MAKQTLIALALVGALLLALIIMMTRPRLSVMSSLANAVAASHG